MESKKRCFDIEAVKACFVKIKEESTPKDYINTLLLCCLLVFYSLTFFVPKFYGLTEKYVGLFVFTVLVLIFIVNINPVKKLKEKDLDFIALMLLGITAFVNIMLVNSGFGCFFVAVDFALIWYLSGNIPFRKWQMYLFGMLYTLMLIYWFFAVYTWMFADYSSFAMNTNTAATFTVFSTLCAFPFFDALYEKHKIAGLLITIALIKCFQISLYHRSRGAFIMLSVFFVLRFLVPPKAWENRRFYRFMCIFSTIGSLFFVAFYIVLGLTGINFTMPFFYKNIFSGREAIWFEFFSLFKDKPLTGIGTNVTIQSFFEFNVHNAMYNILVIHGLIVFALTLFLMFRTWKRAQKDMSIRRISRCALTAVFAVCVESFFDVDLIWANYTLNVFLLLLIMNRRTETE